MVSERDRIINLKQYLESLGVVVNLCKTKARGSKGIFIQKRNSYRIDISKNTEQEKIIPVMLHEFAHYIHYKNDSKLKSLEFSFGEITDEIKEELIEITVQDVPKDFAQSLYDKKNLLNSQIKLLSKNIKAVYPEFKLSEPIKEAERRFTAPLKYLLKYDAVKIGHKIYTINNLDNDFEKLGAAEKDYIILKSKQRFINRINSKINKLNKYYNNPSELFARFVEYYFTKHDLTKKLAPNACKKFEEHILYNMPFWNKIPEIIGF